MANKIGFSPSDNICDLAHLIRSIQRLEGNPTCFGSAYKNCDQQDCAWLEYCLEETQKGSVKNKKRQSKK
jgi:hypothetical protein